MSTPRGLSLQLLGTVAFISDDDWEIDDNGRSGATHRLEHSFPA